MVDESGNGGDKYKDVRPVTESHTVNDAVYVDGQT